MRIIDVECFIDYPAEAVDPKSGKLKRPVRYAFFPLMPKAQDWFIEKYDRYVRPHSLLRLYACNGYGETIRLPIPAKKGYSSVHEVSYYRFDSRIDDVGGIYGLNIGSEGMNPENIDLAEQVVKDLRDEGFKVTFKKHGIVTYWM